MTRPLIVQKYGGSSLATPAQIKDAAARISELHRQGHPLLIVVSAMGKTTDQLVDLAYQVSPTPNRRELDMLLTTGERVSMALMSMALNDLGCPSISFTGSQAGVLTDELHSGARIIDVRPTRVDAELSTKHVVVLAGFQGVSPKTKEITTLGRGGSDTTAVAMAAHFKAERCEIRKDVDGVYSADPNKIENTSHLPHLHYLAMLDMTYWGAKVLHYRSVELAALMKIPVMIALAHGDGRNTLIDGEAQMFEEARILSVNSHQHVRRIRFPGKTLAAALRDLNSALEATNLPIPQYLDSEVSKDATTLTITCPKESLNAVLQLGQKNATCQFSADTAELASVTATCQGAFASPLPGTVMDALEKAGIGVQKMIFGAMSITVLVSETDRGRTIEVLHGLRI